MSKQAPADQASESPKITVISTNFNHGRFLRATIDSVLNQSFKNIQYIVVDGGSTDESVEILREYPRVEWISEKDEGPFQAFEKGLRMAKGEYIMQCAVTDGYLDPDWFQKCIDELERDPEISLVWGLSRHMAEDGTLMGMTYPQFATVEPAQKQEYFYYWLSTFFWFPEGNFCIRRNVFEQCFRKYIPAEYKVNGKLQFDPWLEFNYLFNKSGYLPKFLRTEASFGRFHSDQRTQSEVKDGAGTTVFNHYTRNATNYRRNVLAGHAHEYHDPNGRKLSYAFSRSTFIRNYVLTLRFLINLIKPLLRPLVKQLMRMEGIAVFLRKLKKFS
jgi:glycosyltransferase involved in cell wall biosynthesis